MDTGLLGNFDSAQLQQLMQQFGATEAEKKDANKQALFALGFGLLGGRRGQELATIGHAGMGAMQYRQHVLDDAQQNKMRGMAGGVAMTQFVQAQQDRQARISQQQRLDALTQASGVPGLPQMGPPTAQGDMQPPVAPSFDKSGFAAGLWNIDPQKALAFEQAQAKESPFAKIDPAHYTQASMARYVQSQNPADLRPLDANTMGKINPSDFTPSSVGLYMRSQNYSDLVPIDKRAVTNVSVKNVGESEYDKTLGKSSAETYVSYQVAGRNADSMITKLNAMDKLLSGVDTSGLTPIGMQVAGIAKGLGITLDPNLPSKQAAEAIANEMALQSRQGGQMPGAMSDKDREFLQAMNPNLGQTPEGRALLIETRKRVAQREKEVARLARDYAAKNKGRLDSGFDNEIAAYADAHPLFTEREQAAVPANVKKVVRFQDLK